MTVSCVDLQMSFGGVRALEDVNEKFLPAQAAGIIGPNGAGKTTLLNVLTGFLRPDAGRWFIDDRELTHLSPHRVAKCGIARTFQDIRVIADFTVKENLMMAVSNHPGERLAAVLLSPKRAMDEKNSAFATAKKLERFGLAEVAETQARTLSFGQQKLLALACAVASAHTMLFLDEPFAGLDTTTADLVCEILREQVDGGKGVVFVEHDLTMVERLADIVLLMQGGRVVDKDVPDQLFSGEGFLDAFIH